MAVTEELRVEVQAEVDKAVRNMREFQGATKKSSKAANKLGKVFKRGMYAAAAAVSIGALTKAMKSSIAAFQEQEEAEKALSSAAERNPLLNASSAKRLEDFAGELQKVSTVGDETAMRMASVAASSGRTEEEIQKMVQAAADVSSAMGITMESAMRGLNKSFGGTTGELGELVPELQNLDKEALEAGEGVDLIRDKFDGAAESMADTASGGLKQLNNAFGDLQETVGEQLLGNMDGLIGSLTNFITKAADARKEALQLTDAIEGDLSDDPTRRVEELNDAIETLESKIESAREASGGGGLVGGGANIANMERELESLEEQRVAAARRASAEREAARYAEANNVQAQRQAEAEAEAAKWTDLRIGHQRAIAEEMDDINAKSELFGDSFDAQAAKAQLVQEHLEEMIDEGFTPGGRGIERILNLYGEWIDKQDEVSKATARWGSEVADLSGVLGSTSGGIKELFEERRQIQMEFYQTERDQIEQQKQAYIDAGVARVDAEAWAQEQIRQQNIDTASEILSAFQNVYGQLGGLVSAYSQLQQNQLQRTMNEYDERMEKLEEQHERQLEFAKARGASEQELTEIREQQEKEKEKLEEEKEKKKRKAEKKAFQREKAMQIAEATMAGAQAFVQALTAGPIAGPALAASIAAMTAGQIALISQQSYPGLASGGIVPAQGDSGGLYRLGDKNKAETVLPFDIRDAQGGSSQVVFNGSVNAYGAGGVDELAETIDKSVKRQKKTGAISA